MGNAEFDPTDLILHQAKMEEWKDGMEKRVSVLETENKALNRIAFVVEMQQKTMDSQQKTMDLINQTLVEINKGNMEIGHEIKAIKQDVSELNLKVEEIESTDNINLPKLFRKIAWQVLVPAITLLVGYFFAQWGLK